MARVAEQAERFDELVDFLKQVIEGKDKDFTTEERPFKCRFQKLDRR